MEVQTRADTSLLAHYRTLITLRNAQPALTFGGIEPIEGGDERLVAFLRTHDSGPLLVEHNLSGETVVWSSPESARPFRRVLYRSRADARIVGAPVSLPPHSTVILRR